MRARVMYTPQIRRHHGSKRDEPHAAWACCRKFQSAQAVVGASGDMQGIAGELVAVVMVVLVMMMQFQYQCQ